MEKVKVAPNISVKFIQNGHLYGAAMILVTVKYTGQQSINIIFTGDYNCKNAFFKLDQFPRQILKKPVVIVQESTYGTTESTEIESKFEAKVECALKENKTVIAPSYSLGRAQEVICKLRKMQNSGKISPDIPIYLDSKLAISYTKIFLSDKVDIYPEMVELLSSGVIYVDKEIRGKLLTDSEPKVIVTSSGSGSFGNAKTYIQEYISRKDALILFTGYTPKDSLGSRLKQTPIGETAQVGGKTKIRQAEVDYTGEFSAHAKADEMIEFLQQFEKPELILVNHGEYDTKEKFAERVSNEIKNAKNVFAFDRSTFYRIGSYGMIKRVGSKIWIKNKG